MRNRTTDLPYVFGPLTPLLAALLPESERRREQVKRELISAGFHQPYAFENLSAIRYLGLMLPMSILALLTVLVPEWLSPMAVGLLLFLPALGWAVPRLVVRTLARKRRDEIERGLPDLLDLLEMGISQGLSVPQSLARIGRELARVCPALGQELIITAEQARIGSLEQALENFARRADLPMVQAFTGLLIQTERLGTSISQVLADSSDMLRESLRHRADERANKAAFKLLFPTACCLLPAVFLILMGPALIQFSDFFTPANPLDDINQKTLPILTPEQWDAD